MMREAALEDLSKDLSEINNIGKNISSDVNKIKFDLSSWTTPPEVSGSEALHHTGNDEVDKSKGSASTIENPDKSG
jgi:hypothetical protein